MSINKIVSSFFKSHKPCFHCKNLLHKDILITYIFPFEEGDMSYYSIWDNEDNSFKLSDNMGNRSPEGFDVLASTSLAQLNDIVTQCISLNKLGYYVKVVQLGINCDNCNFYHSLILKWHDLRLYLSTEAVNIDKFTVRHNFEKQTSTIADHNNIKPIIYDFDYLIKIRLSNYKSINNKIQQILLLR